MEVAAVLESYVSQPCPSGRWVQLPHSSLNDAWLQVAGVPRIPGAAPGTPCAGELRGGSGSKLPSIFSIVGPAILRMDIGF